MRLAGFTMLKLLLNNCLEMDAIRAKLRSSPREPFAHEGPARTPPGALATYRRAGVGRTAPDALLPHLDSHTLDAAPFGLA